MNQNLPLFIFEKCLYTHQPKMMENKQTQMRKIETEKTHLIRNGYLVSLN